MKFYLKIVKEDSIIHELAWEESYNMEGQPCIHFWKIFNEQEGMAVRSEKEARVERHVQEDNILLFWKDVQMKKACLSLWA